MEYGLATVKKQFGPIVGCRRNKILPKIIRLKHNINSERVLQGSKKG